MVNRGGFVILGLLSLGLSWGILYPVLEVQGQNITSAIANSDANSDSRTLVEQGKQLYQAGQLTEAARILQQAIAELTAQGDTLNQAIALANLSLIWQALGEWQQAESAVNLAINISLQWVQERPEILAQVLNIQGQLQFAQGHPEQALTTWKQATKHYQETGNLSGSIASQINQAQALQALGLYRQGLHTLQNLQGVLSAQPNSELKVMGLKSLGDALRVVGDLNQAETVLQQGLTLAETIHPSQPEVSQLVAELSMSLGNVAQAQGQTETALELYQNAINTSESDLIQVQAQLNQLQLWVTTEQWASARQLISQVQAQLLTLPPSRLKVYAAVNLANRLAQIPGTPALQPQAITLLTLAVQEARTLQDIRAEAHALGSLGRIYEQNQQGSIAQTFTTQALLLAQSIQASDIAYQWQWQLGRLLKVQGKTVEAIAAYTEAVNTLNSLRSDLVAINPEVQFSFRESVEPVYRELVGLILQPEGLGQQPNQKNLEKARALMESLQLAELDNFFREACLDASLQPQNIDQIDPTAAVLYPIILADRLEVILALPGKPLQSYSTPVPQAQVEATARQLRQILRPVFSTQQRLELSQQIYNWLIQPAAADLNDHQIQTLVFVLDGELRNLPMAVLFDGQRYLLETYNLVVTPGLQLLKPQLGQTQIQTLAMGLTEARQGFVALPAVGFEIEQIQAQIPSTVLLNQQFTLGNLAAQIQQGDFPIIHLATHGQFSSRAEDTFLLTWDSRVNVKDLDQLLRSRSAGSLTPIELLVLSACQTAAGDRKAALGLAGVAVGSGARSTVASLWQVNDVSTALFMAEFYQALTQPGINKAEALRQAQLQLLQQPKYSDPFYWAAFLLVGNWL
ncbi:MAG: CHAT domain-containing protein [Microcoleaceae cyanobacterium]